MPRSYSFDHFTVPKPDLSKRPHPGDRERLAKPWPRRVLGLHYGRQHAETEQLYRSHEAEHREEDEDPPRAGVPRLTAPIGALPAMPERHPVMEIREALGDGGRHLRAMAEAARALLGDGMRLVRLPFEVTVLIARRVLPGRA